jgi:NAD(P)-dependent dehydrogenase (short-subunit alcohol dehydrogenase family)
MMFCLGVCDGARDRRVGSWNRRNGETVFLPGRRESEGVGGLFEAMARQENKSNKEIEKEFFRNVRPSSLLKRFATADEVAAIATYLASELLRRRTGRRCE